MIESLDRYSPAAWHENGLLKIKPVKKSQPARETRKVKPLVTAVVLSLAYVGISSPAKFRFGASNGTHVVAHRELVATATSPELAIRGDFISPSSWPEIMAMIKNAPEVVEPDGDDPEPLI